MCTTINCVTLCSLCYSITILSTSFWSPSLFWCIIWITCSCAILLSIPTPLLCSFTWYCLSIFSLTSPLISYSFSISIYQFSFSISWFTNFCWCCYPWILFFQIIMHSIIFWITLSSFFYWSTWIATSFWSPSFFTCIFWITCFCSISFSISTPLLYSFTKYCFLNPLHTIPCILFWQSIPIYLSCSVSSITKICTFCYPWFYFWIIIMNSRINSITCSRLSYSITILTYIIMITIIFYLLYLLDHILHYLV